MTHAEANAKLQERLDELKARRDAMCAQPDCLDLLALEQVMREIGYITESMGQIAAFKK